MPTYDYQCDACGHTFELFQGINDPKKKKCPQCNQLKLRRLLGTGAAIVFKGSGFYQTDYRSDSYKKAAAADSSSGGESKSTETGKAGQSSKAEATAPSKGSPPASSSKSSATPPKSSSADS